MNEVERIIPHVFLLLKLPDGSNPEEVLQEETCLLRTFCDFLAEQQYDGRHFPHTAQAFNVWRQIQDSNDEELLSLSLADLKAGHSLPVYVRAQNAGLLFTCSDACCDGHPAESTVVSTFATSQKSAEVSSAASDLIAEYPMKSIHVPKSQLLTSKLLARQIISLNHNALSEAMTKKLKSSMYYDDQRDVADPMFVSKWLCGLLCDMDSCLCTKIPRIIKKVRDEVVFGRRHSLPFRRSGMWMMIKVVLQMLLVKELGPSVGQQMYKMILLKFMCSLCAFESATADIGVQIMAKIARRLYKLHKLEDRMDITNEFILRKLHNDAEAAVESLRERLDSEWNAKVEEDLKKTSLSLSGNFDFLKDSKHSLVPLLNYIKYRNDSKAGNRQDADGESEKISIPARDPNLSALPFTVLTVFSTQGKQALRSLFCFEYRVLNNLRNSQSVDYAKVVKTFISYLKAAKTVYDGDQVGISRAVLVCLRIIWLVDQAVCKSYALMQEHKTGVPIKIIEHLMLPFKSDLKLAHELEAYFENRERISRYPCLLAPCDPFARDSPYSVRHAERDEIMQDKLNEILAEGVRKADEKMDEVRMKKRQLEELRSKIRTMSCECEYIRGNLCRCQKCRLQDEDDGMYITLYEKPLPTASQIQNAIVFELLIPEPIFYYREMLCALLKHFEVFTFSQQCKSMWPSELRRHALPHSGSLAISLGSMAAPQNRYYPRGLHPSADLRQFVVENTGDVRLCLAEKALQPHQEIPPNVLRRFVFKVESASPYSGLQWVLDDHGYEFSDNQILAKQNQCPAELSLIEFKEFGSIRAGHRIQLRNLYRALSQRTLSLNTESVLNLVYEVLWRAGPPCYDPSFPAYIRESHVDLLCSGFLTELISSLEILISSFSDNWNNHHACAAVIAILQRIISISEDDSVSKVCFVLLQACRKILRDWCCNIEQILDTMENEPVVEQNKMRKKLVAVATLCCCTYWSDTPWEVRENLVEYVLPWLLSIKIIQEYMGDQNFLLSCGNTFRNRVRRFQECGCVNLSSFHKLITTEEEVLQAFTKATWSGFSVCEARVNWKCYEGDLQWFMAEVSIKGCNTVLMTDILEGRFLVNGKPQDCLPSELKNHVDYRRIFGDFVIKVQPLTQSPWSAMSKHTFHGEKYRFIENRNSQFSHWANPFVISKIAINEVEYVPENAFQGRLLPGSGKAVLCFQQFLITDYTHWWNAKRRCIDFRSKKCNTSKFCLDLNSGLVNEAVTGRLAIDNASPTYQRVMQIFTCLEQEVFIEIFLHSLGEPEILAVQLPRMRLHFKVVKEGSKLCVSSLEYPGMKVSEVQKCGTLVGLKSCLLLEPTEENFSNKLLLIPHGRVDLPKENDAVLIDTVTLRSPPYFAYEVDSTLQQLKCGQTKSASVYLAYLHALTSHSLPDPFTFHTGTERALQLLQSGHCWSCEPYDDETAKTLMLIAKLSPERKYNSKYKAMTSSSWLLPSAIACSDAYQMIVEKLISDSQRLSNLFESKPNVKPNYKNEPVLCKKSYWKYFKCTTVQGHISPQFLAMYPPPLVKSATFDCSFADANMKSVLKLVFLVNEWSTEPYTNRNLHISVVGGRQTLGGNCIPFPLSGKVVELQALEFWDSWLTLYDLAKQVKGKNCEEEWKIILTSYAFMGIPYVQLLLLHTIAVFQEVFENLNPPNCEAYKDPEETTFCPIKVGSIIESNVRMSYNSFLEQQQIAGCSAGSKIYSEMRTLYDKRLQSQIDGLTNELKCASWPLRSCCNIVDGYSGECDFLHMENIKHSVDILLKKWVDNYELKQFIDKVETFVIQIGKLPQVVELDAKQVFRKLSLQIQLNDSNVTETPVEFGIHEVVTEVDVIDAYKDVIKEAKTVFQKGIIADSSVRSLFCTGIRSGYDGENSQKENVYDNDVYHDILLDPTASINNCNIWENLVDCLKIDTNHSTLDENSNYAYMEGPALLTELQRHLKFCTDAQRKYWTVAQTMILSDPLVKILATAGIYQRITPLTTLPLIFHEESTQSHTHNCLRNVIGAFGVAETCKKHVLRCLKYLKSKSPFELHREMINVPHENWSPTEKPEWLCFEIEMDLLVRPIQKQIAERMETPENDCNAVTQLNMGEGKTAVITPLLLLSLADTKQLCRVTVLKSLFNTNKQALELNLGGVLLNRRVYSFPCCRDFSMDAKLVQTMFDVYRECVDKGGINITTPEYRLSFQLKTYEQCKVGNHQVAAVLLDIQEWLRKNARDILDESDEILQVKYQLIYALGEQMPPTGGSQRWTLLQRLLDKIPEVVKKLAALPDTGCVQIYENDSEIASFPHCRLLKMDIYDRFCNLLTDKILSGTEFPNLQTQDKEFLRQFLTKEEIDVSVIQRVFAFLPSGSAAAFNEKALILRGLLACGVLYATMNKRWRVNYGVSPSGRSPLAVPFRAKDVAAERTEFGHPDVTLVLTHLSYYYSGLTESQVSECLFHVMQGPNPEMEYDGWISAIKNPDPSICSLRGINLDDPLQRNKKLFPALRKNKAVIDFWLGNIVLPVTVKQFPSKIVSTAWDLASDQAQRTTTGFSGTNDTQILLPLTIAQKDVPELQRTNYKVFKTLLLEENGSYEHFPPRVSSVDILKKLEAVNIPLLLDVGALMLELDNEAVAKTWLTFVKEEDKKAAIYFSAKNRLMVMDRSALEPVPFEISPFRSMLDQCLIYLDDIHTRGTDLKLPAGIKGCVTLGKGVTKDKLVQGCMRLRRLGKGHTVCFWASSEVNNEITAMANPSRKLGSGDVLRWTLNNSRNMMREGFPHWVAAACNYLSKTAAQSRYDATGRIDYDRTRLAEQVSVKEVTGLNEMYGNPGNIASFPTFAAQKLEKSCPDGECVGSVMNVFKDRVCKKCEMYVPNLMKCVHLLDEEQERELEKEREEEREVERPGVAKPCTPMLDKDMVKFLKTEHKVFQCENLPAWVVRLPEGLQLTSLADYNETAAWGNGVFATADFLNTIKTQHLKDSYLRTVNWIGSFQMKESLCWLLLSPFEVNSLIPMFRSGQLKAWLHMYAARLSLEQSTFLELDNLVLPVGMTPSMKFMPEFYDLNASLSIFSGVTFFQNMLECDSYCAVTGYIPYPRSAKEKEALSRPIVDNAGFLLPSPHQELRPHCHLQRNPEQLIVGVINCRYNYFSRLSHVARLVHECQKPTFD